MSVLLSFPPVRVRCLRRRYCFPARAAGGSSPHPSPPAPSRSGRRPSRRLGWSPRLLPARSWSPPDARPRPNNPHETAIKSERLSRGGFLAQSSGSRPWRSLSGDGPCRAETGLYGFRGGRAVGLGGAGVELGGWSGVRFWPLPRQNPHRLARFRRSEAGSAHGDGRRGSGYRTGGGRRRGVGAPAALPRTRMRSPGSTTAAKLGCGCVAGRWTGVAATRGGTSESAFTALGAG